MLVNFGQRERTVTLDGGWLVEVDSAATTGADPAAFDGVLRPDQAVLLRPGLPG